MEDLRSDGGNTTDGGPESEESGEMPGLTGGIETDSEAVGGSEGEDGDMPGLACMDDNSDKCLLLF